MGAHFFPPIDAHAGVESCGVVLVGEDVEFAGCAFGLNFFGERSADDPPVAVGAIESDRSSFAVCGALGHEALDGSWHERFRALSAFIKECAVPELDEMNVGVDDRAAGGLDEGIGLRRGFGEHRVDAPFEFDRAELPCWENRRDAMPCDTVAGGDVAAECKDIDFVEAIAESVECTNPCAHGRAFTGDEGIDYEEVHVMGKSGRGKS